MNISSDTLKVLKNFAAINPNIVCKPGQKLSTISDAKNILASADIQEDFPQEFGIYDLNEFLSVVNLIDDAALSFDEKFVTVAGDNKQKINYYFSSPEILTSPEKDLTMPSAEFNISLSMDTLANIRKAATVLGHNELVIEGNNGDVCAKVIDSKDATANAYEIHLDHNNDCKNKFSFVVNIANLKLLEGDYFLSISSKLISSWQNTDFPVNYFIALEKTSEFHV
jgi:hypothetical protein